MVIASVSGRLGARRAYYDPEVAIALSDSPRHPSMHCAQRVKALEREMDEGRRKRLRRLGFDDAAAGERSALHTRNFM